MPLEDHAGDIIRKSRMGLGVAREAVARAGQINPDQLDAFEEHGQTPPRFDFEKVAALLTLSAEKLKRVAEGWEPTTTDPAKWQHLRHIETDDGGMAVNCFLVWDPHTGDAALFDTGWILGPIQNCLDQHQLQLRHIFITHSHYDHIEALGAVRQYAPEAALHSNIATAPANQRLTPDETFTLGRLTIGYRPTPGHADDGVTYLVSGFSGGMPSLAIVGDAIFAGSIGGARNHFDLARTKIRDEILSLPMETLICPGHGPLSTVAEEQANNPFFL